MHDWPRFDRTALRESRMGKTRHLMDRLKLDHLLLTAFDTIRFVTDYRTLIIAEAFDWFAAVVDRGGESEVFVPWVDEILSDPEPEMPWIRALHPLPSWTPAIPHAGFWVRSLVGALRRRGAKHVGLDMLDGQLLETLRQELPDVGFTHVATELQDLRLVKERVELELLAATSGVNSRAAEAAMDGANAGMLDFDVLALAMESLQRDGVEYLSHSLCNVRRGSGTWFAVGNKLNDGDAYFFDIGCYGPGGYASDLARTSFVNEPPKKVQEAYQRLLEAHHVGEEAARPGVRASSVHEAVNGFLRAHKLPITPYSVGHGVGLRACELPTIYRADRMGRDQALEEGMVISLEPETGVEVNGRFVLLKVEDNYVVEGQGLRRLSEAHYGTGSFR